MHEYHCGDCHKKIGEMPSGLQEVSFIVRCPHCESLNKIQIGISTNVFVARWYVKEGEQE